MVFFALLFLGCSTKTTPVYLTFNTPKIKISDQGFLKEGFGYKKIIIYKAGIKPFEIVLKNSSVCFNNKCMDKKRFIKDIDKNYPLDLLDDILNHKPLYFLGKILKKKDGFIQKNDRFLYIVKKNSVLFKDRKKRAVIMLKYLKKKL